MLLPAAPSHRASLVISASQPQGSRPEAGCVLQTFRDGSGTTGIVDFPSRDDMKYAIRKLDDSEFKNPLCALPTSGLLLPAPVCSSRQLQRAALLATACRAVPLWDGGRATDQAQLRPSLECSRTGPPRLQQLQCIARQSPSRCCGAPL